MQSSAVKWALVGLTVVGLSGCKSASDKLTGSSWRWGKKAQASEAALASATPIRPSAQSTPAPLAGNGYAGATSGGYGAPQYGTQQYGANTGYGAPVAAVPANGYAQAGAGTTYPEALPGGYPTTPAGYDTTNPGAYATPANGGYPTAGGYATSAAPGGTMAPQTGAYNPDYNQWSNPAATSGSGYTGTPSTGYGTASAGTPRYEPAGGYSLPASNAASPWSSSGAGATTAATSNPSGYPNPWASSTASTTNTGTVPSNAWSSTGSAGGAAALTASSQNHFAAGAGSQSGYSASPAGTPAPAPSSWMPGNTGYSPPAATPYQMPAGAAPATNPAEYRPGSTSVYPPTSAVQPAVNPASASTSTVQPVSYGQPINALTPPRVELPAR